MRLFGRLSRRSAFAPTRLVLIAFAVVAFGPASMATPRVSAQAKPPQRIISVIPAVTEMLFAIDAGPQVVAVGTFDRYPPQVDRLPRVGALVDPDVERILSLEPDLVAVYASQTDLRTQLARADIPMYVYSHAGLADVTTDHPRTRRTGRACRGRGTTCGLDRNANRGHPPARRRRAAAAYADRLRPRTGHAPWHLCERRHRFHQRHGRGRGGRERLCRHQTAGGSGNDRTDPRPPPRGDSGTARVGNHARAGAKRNQGLGSPVLPPGRPHPPGLPADRRANGGAWAEGRGGDRADCPRAGSGLRLRAQGSGSGLRAQGSGFRAQGSRLKAQG